MFQNRLLLDSEACIQHICSSDSLLKVVTQSPLKNADTPAETPAETPAMVELTPSRSASIWPILTKPHYELTPSLNELSLMSESALHAVKNVKISMKAVGSIEWEEPVDLCGLNLDMLVTFIIEDGYPSVSVGRQTQRDEIADGQVNPTKDMPPGTGINKQAVVTLVGVLLPDDCTEEEMEELLKLRCVETNSEFISYEAISGVWKFRVSHF